MRQACPLRCCEPQLDGAEGLRDAEYRAQIVRVKKLTKLWSGILGAGWFHIQLCFEREGIEGAHHTGMPYLACTEGSWEYMNFTIRWNMPLVLETGDEELENAVVHEFMHVFLREMEAEGAGHEERVATLLARAIIFTRDSR